MRHSVLTAFALVSLGIVACGRGDKSSGDGPDDAIAPPSAGEDPGAAVDVKSAAGGPDKSLSIVSSEADLPPCNPGSEGKVIYVKATKAFRACSAGAWETLDLAGPAGADGQNGQSGEDGENGKTTYVEDSEGTELGQLLSASWDRLTIMSSEGYLYHLSWDGTLVSPAGLYYSSNDCSGEPRALVNPGAMLGFGVYIDGFGNLYKPKNLDSNGNVTGASFNKNSGYAYGYGQVCSAGAGTVTAIELEPTTRAEVGIPENIGPKVSIVTK